LTPTARPDDVPYAAPTRAVPGSPGAAQDQDTGQALFNPFGAAAVVMQQQATPALPTPSDGGWSLPLAAVLAGAWVLALLVRTILD
jgi:hypothetical protein